MMTKQEAAQFLGVSQRAINRYAVRGLLTPSYNRMPHGAMRAEYDVEEVKKLKENPPERPIPIKRNTGALVRSDAFKEELVQLLQSLASRVDNVKSTYVPMEARLTLTLDDASLWTGLPREFIRKAVKAGKLKAIKVARGEWNVKRSALKAWIKKL